MAAALLGGPRLALVPYLLLWLGLIVGPVCGAAAHRAFGLDGLWIAASASAALTAAAVRVAPADPDRPDTAPPA